MNVPLRTMRRDANTHGVPVLNRPEPTTTPRTSKQIGEEPEHWIVSVAHHGAEVVTEVTMTVVPPQEAAPNAPTTVEVIALEVAGVIRRMDRT
jgi:hypothetical protein